MHLMKCIFMSHMHINKSQHFDSSLSICMNYIFFQLKLLPEPPSLSKEPIVLQLRELNPYITCALCGGYLYEASTITECMHTCE